MNPNQDQLRQSSGSARPTQPAFLTAATGHPNQPHAPIHQFHSVNPLHTLRDPSKAQTRPYLYSSRSPSIHVPLSSPHLASSASTPSHTTTTPSPILSVRTPSTRDSSLQPPSARPSPAQSSSTPLPRGNTRSVPSKRARDYTPGPPTLYPTSPIPSSSSLSLNHPPHVSSPSPHLLPTEPPSERPAKRPRLGAGRSNTATINRRGMQPPAFSKPSPLSQPSSVGTTPSEPKPKRRKGTLHPLAVDYSRPMKPVVPQPPFCRLSLRQNHIPLPPYPENPDPGRLLDEELKGPIDTAMARELGDLMWMQQKRVWDTLGGYSDPFILSPIPTSLLGIRPSSPCEEVTPAHSRQETIGLYGPPLRNNESIRLGESLTNPNVIVLDDDENDGFEEVLDLYRGAVQGSRLSRELELAVEGDNGLASVGWDDASSLEVSIKRSPSAPSSPVEPKGTCIRTLAEYRRVVEAEKVLSPSSPVTVGEPPLGIEWSYGCCGYVTGRVVNPQKAKTRR